MNGFPKQDWTHKNPSCWRAFNEAHPFVLFTPLIQDFTSNDFMAMKYLFQALMLVYFVAAFTNSNQMTNPAGRCNINNYYTFSAGPNCKKIDTAMSEVKQQLAELKQQIMEMEENQTEGPTEKGLQWIFLKLQQAPANGLLWGIKFRL